MIGTTIINIFKNVWPMILIFTTIVISMRITYIIKNHPTVYLYKDLMVLGFVIYILCLFHVVTFQDVSWSTSNFIPFREMFRYEFGTGLFFKNVVGNMIMFLPFGFFVSYFLNLAKIRYIFILSLVSSLSIETTQMVIGRVFDVDDIMLNIIGGILGYFIYRIIFKIKEHLPAMLKKPVFYNIIMVTVLILIFIYIYMIIEAGI